jgi:hypothetical protein
MTEIHLAELLLAFIGGLLVGGIGARILYHSLITRSVITGE